MNDLFTIFISMALINNFVLARFLGLCPFLGVSQKLSSALSMGAAVTMVMLVAATVTWFLDNVLIDPFGVAYITTVMFILVIASLVQILELTIRRTNISLYNALGIYLPLITTNCAVLGVTLINSREGFTLLEAIVSALGAGLGFMLVLAMMSGIRERLQIADVPVSFKGQPTAFLTAALLGMCFLAFTGMV